MLNQLYSLLGIIKDLPDSKQRQLLELFKKISSEKELEDLVKEIDSISDDPYIADQTRHNSLERIKRYVLSVKKHNNINKQRFFLPVVNKGELIYVRFSGIGSEHDQEHYAIVWEVDRKRDHIVVIPATSFKDDSTIETGISFNIGNVGFMESQTVVLLNQITTISRKRIISVKHYNPLTGQYEFARISPDQEKRIRDGFRVMCLGEKTLFDEIFGHKKILPVFEDPIIQYQHLLRPYIKIETETTPEKLVYALHEEPNIHYTVYRYPHNLNTSQRQMLLKQWLNAKATYSDVQGKKILIKSREDARQEAYHKIQQHIIKPEVTTNQKEVTI